MSDDELIDLARSRRRGNVMYMTKAEIADTWQSVDYTVRYSAPLKIMGYYVIEVPDEMLQR